MNKKLKIGYFTDIPYFDSAVCIKNAIRNCVAELSKNHEVVEFKIPNPQFLAKLFLRAGTANGNRDLKRDLNGETPEAYNKAAIAVHDNPLFSKLKLFFAKLIGQARLYEFYESIKGFLSSAEYIELCYEIQDYTEELTKYWESLQIDVVVCPAFGTIAPYHVAGDFMVNALVYCFVWNVVAFPSGVVPVCLVKSDETEYKDEFNDFISDAGKRHMKNSEGMPVGLQVVGLPYKDELVLKGMKLIENIFQFHKHPL